jgi:hypothetical protein
VGRTERIEMNPMLMQMWMVAFGAYVERTKGSGVIVGYEAAKYADEVLRGAQKAAEEAKAEQSKVVMT